MTALLAMVRKTGCSIICFSVNEKLLNILSYLQIKKRQKFETVPLSVNFWFTQDNLDLV